MLESLGRRKGRRHDRDCQARSRRIAGYSNRNSPRSAALYPVEFNRRLAMLEDGRFGSETPWPLEFTREGLGGGVSLAGRLGPAAASTIWSSFPGVFGYYNVHGAKPGATVYARYSDPEAASGGQLPVYMAGHFYGAGRVFYLGSGEMWRLRALDESYFEQFYTKLLRHVSQGRLLVGSSRGMLLVERDRYLARAARSQFGPCSATRTSSRLEVPRIPLEIAQPDSTLQTLQPDGRCDSRKGCTSGQFTALQEGTYRLELAMPDSPETRLSKRIQVKVPDLERENPERNDALLTDIAEKTGGRYYVGMAAALGRAACRRSLVNSRTAPRPAIRRASKIRTSICGGCEPDVARLRSAESGVVDPTFIEAGMSEA